MKRFKKLTNLVGAAVFGALGVAALAGAVFFGATHQLIIAAIGAVMTTVLLSEVRREAKKQNKLI